MPPNPNPEARRQGLVVRCACGKEYCVRPGTPPGPRRCFLCGGSYEVPAATAGVAPPAPAAAPEIPGGADQPSAETLPGPEAAWVLRCEAEVVGLGWLSRVGGLIMVGLGVWILIQTFQAPFSEASLVAVGFALAAFIWAAVSFSIGSGLLRFEASSQIAAIVMGGLGMVLIAYLLLQPLPRGKGSFPQGIGAGGLAFELAMLLFLCHPAVSRLFREGRNRAMAANREAQRPQSLVVLLGLGWYLYCLVVVGMSASRYPR